LLLTFFFRYMRPLIEKGYVYIAQPPLYKAKLGKHEQYLKNERAFKDFVLNWAQSHIIIKSKIKTYEGDDLVPLLDSITEFDDKLERVSQHFCLEREYIHKLTQLLIKDPAIATKPALHIHEKLTELFKDDKVTLVHEEIAEACVQDPDAPLDETVIETPPAVVKGFRVEQDNHTFVIPTNFFASQDTQAYLSLHNKLHSLIGDQWSIKIAGKDVQAQGTQLGYLIGTILKISKPFMNVSRYKGLGEMNPEQLWETTMDPEARRLLQVTIDDEVEADEWFSTLMGDNVAGRKAFIENNGQFVKNLDV
jgi:DNA gyrase subunit B